MCIIRWMICHSTIYTLSFVLSMNFRARHSYAITFGYRGCVNRLRASGICLISCTHPLPKSQLLASVKMAFLVACIRAKKDPCLHLFEKPSLRASVFKSLKTKIWIQSSETLVFATRFLRQPFVSISKLLSMRGYTINRNHSSCNLNPNGVGGHGHPLL